MIAHCECTLDSGKTFKLIRLFTSVNEIFDPERVDEFYEQPSDVREDTLYRNKSTNYGVVRPELLDRLYEIMYHQRLHQPDESKWQYKIVPRREVTNYDRQEDGRTRLELKNTLTGHVSMSQSAFDLVIVATGYVRNVHEALLKATKDLLQTGKYDIGRDYKVKYKKDAVANNCGIWLQGCCQDSHGVSCTPVHTYTHPRKYKKELLRPFL